MVKLDELEKTTLDLIASEPLQRFRVTLNGLALWRYSVLRLPTTEAG